MPWRFLPKIALFVAIGVSCQCSAAAQPAAVGRIRQLGGKIETDAAGNVVAVNLLNCAMSDKDLKLLVELAGLKKLELWVAGITDGGIPFLAKLPKLEDLSLENTGITNAGVEAVAKIESLKSLNLRRTTNMTDAALASLTKLPSSNNRPALQQHQRRRPGPPGRHDPAAAAGPPRPSPADRRRHGPPARIDELEKPEYSGTAHVGDPGVKSLEAMRKLVVLSLEDCALTDAALKSLSAMKDMEDLGLLRCTGVTDDGLACLEGMKKLKRLDLRGIPLSGAGLTRLLRRDYGGWT